MAVKKAVRGIQPRLNRRTGIVTLTPKQSDTILFKMPCGRGV